MAIWRVRCRGRCWAWQFVINQCLYVFSPSELPTRIHSLLWFLSLSSAYISDMQASCRSLCHLWYSLIWLLDYAPVPRCRLPGFNHVFTQYLPCHITESRMSDLHQILSKFTIIYPLWWLLTQSVSWLIWSIVNAWSTNANLQSKFLYKARRLTICYSVY